LLIPVLVVAIPQGDILLVDDSETDAKLTLEALRRGKLKNNIHHVSDGEEAMRFLLKQDEYTDAPRPDLILLDLDPELFTTTGVWFGL
jgi:CheY-like chemotaxis protein